MTQILKTEIVAYYLNIDSAEDAAAYEALLDKLGDFKNCFNVHADARPGNRDRIKSGPIELETKCLFNNQWNTTEASGNLRVFDWYEGIYPNSRIKAGHYLVVTDEMQAIRDRTYSCGYCGHLHREHHIVADAPFCKQCLGSEYLEVDNFKLLRLRPVSCSNRNFSDLTKAEHSKLMAEYILAQTKGNSARTKQLLKEKLQKLKDACAKRVKLARIERDGFTWLIDNGVKTNNCIFYGHQGDSGTFVFGWRSGYAPEVSAHMEGLLQCFPFLYEFKGEK